MSEKVKQQILVLANLLEHGRGNRPQIIARYYDPATGGVCPIGAMAIGAGWRPGDIMPACSFIRQNVLNTSFPDVIYPAGIGFWINWIDDISKPLGLDTALIMLNDVAGWDFDHMLLWMREIAQ